MYVYYFYTKFLSLESIAYKMDEHWMKLGSVDYESTASIHNYSSPKFNVFFIKFRFLYNPFKCDS